MDNLLRYIGAFFIGFITSVIGYPIISDGSINITNCILLFTVLLVWTLAIDFNIHLNKIRKKPNDPKRY